MSICWELRKNGEMIAWLQERPQYCDRGRYHQGIEVPIVRSDADPMPRYYFDLEAGKRETEAYLRAKKVNIDGAEWVEAHYG
jgi:hypothetical protein